MLNAVELDSDPNEYTSAKRSKFKFKSKSRSRSERSSKLDNEDDTGEHDVPRRHRHRHHHRRKRRKYDSPEPPDNPSQYDDTHLPNASSSQFLDPEAAFRESLFDAMADDEGAQYWEGVYGQPIHIYPNTKTSSKGELERMTDDEYAAYVRAKMYEKTHQHLIEEKAKRAAAKKERDRLSREGRKEEEEAAEFRKKVEESLRRGQERKSRKAWSDIWDSYLRKWSTLTDGALKKVTVRSIPWPVESGDYRDVNALELKRFFLYAPSSGQPTETQLGKVLKLERVRWHPDKIQQKLGGQDVEESVIRQVTAVFQTIDQLWSEVREREGGNATA
ncbi:hypothetical protein F5884DRAFT_679422 [Xylogone sp. PMI_703]|nr:hypothetical protein F5884DRAFT_679422 [Xylogone sp. PMI_703]